MTTQPLIPVYPSKETIDPETGFPISPGGDVISAIRGAKTIMTGQFPNIGAVAVLVITSEPNRRALLLRNLGAVDMYLGPEQSVTSATGWLLSITDGPLVLESSDELWAVSAGAVTTLGFLAELDL